MAIKYYPVIDMIATGKNISVLRKARGLSVSDLQKYFGFDAPQAIYKWQKGQSLPSTDNLYALAFLFGVKVDDIIIPIKPAIQVLPQDDSCGSGRFGAAFLSVARTIKKRMRIAMLACIDPHPDIYTFMHRHEC